jgi:hypothetical protein
MTVIDEIAAERRRQIEQEGWTQRHDDDHTNGALADAAACYAMHSAKGTILTGDAYVRSAAPMFWPWSKGWWKPKDRRRDLIRAGALIVAEMERLDRAAKSEAAA